MLSLECPIHPSISVVTRLLTHSTINMRVKSRAASRPDVGEWWFLRHTPLCLRVCQIVTCFQSWVVNRRWVTFAFQKGVDRRRGSLSPASTHLVENFKGWELDPRASGSPIPVTFKHSLFKSLTLAFPILTWTLVTLQFCDIKRLDISYCLSRDCECVALTLLWSPQTV